jgi:acyl-ACP thioesterase
VSSPPEPRPELVPLPVAGRVFRAERRVRLGDVGIEGRLRIDATARYLQDVARDDSADSGITNPMGWVVRRTHLDVVRAPSFQEQVQLATWCSGYGSRWAERRTSITGDAGGLVETVTLWVHVDPATGRPSRLGPDFHVLYGEAAGGRVVDARLPAEEPPPVAADHGPWPWRLADFDILGHVNNAAYGAAFEEARAAVAGLDGAFRVDVQYRDAVRPGEPGTLVRAAERGGVRVWLTASGRTCCTGWVGPR